MPGTPNPIVDVDEFTEPALSPGTGEPGNQATFLVAFQTLANRTRYLLNRLLQAAAYQPLSIVSGTATLAPASGVNALLTHNDAGSIFVNVTNPTAGHRGLVIVTNSGGTRTPPTFRLNGSTTNVVAPSFTGYWNDEDAAVNVFEWTFDGTRLVVMFHGCSPSLGAPLVTP
jgi:hypothetical protein